ncbi:hypothetical protein EJ05DRAFT_496039 [Pseudovirgaria hyperparasitica]|uniref:Zn(2)-C6 fungal-type domain-containing protein n=1 Tax=Pseudovirgaria hyperparasitica TaxID=470096 RepID=A0A6A6WLY5_9PEZI|nr:uncharacterized protein EJ05DRAFT_496039 [Pseudovirgaria hyperparasitica]KAF2763211.1 hypothetical protein EJ05DRAFT_496039 [Pseudovirgaria hyperparasitica]
MPKDNACWPCRRQKLGCDKTRPKCQRCARCNRDCQYGLQLSFPRHDDKRRGWHHAVVQGVQQMPPEGQLHFINVLFYDLNNHTHMTRGTRLNALSNSLAQTWETISTPRAMPWKPLEAIGENGLIQYYQDVIGSIVSTVSQNDCYSVLMRMAFCTESSASEAVRLAICALACLHMCGGKHASVLRTQARHHFLMIQSQLDDPQELLQSIVAAMLLGLYEIFDQPHSDAPYSWALDVCYAKKALGAMEIPTNSPVTSDESLLLDWVTYHDVMSKFSITHYVDRQEDQVECANNKCLRQKQMSASSKTKISGPVGCSIELLLVISRVFDAAYEQEMGAGQVSDDRVDSLEHSILNARQVLEVESVSHDRAVVIEEDAMKHIAELFRLAGLIYLHRAIKKSPPWLPPVSMWVSEAYDHLRKITVCDRNFPLFIIACEARTDEQRSEILRVLRNSEEKSKVGNTLRVRQFIERVWAQDDLDQEQRIKYTSKITASLSTCNALPAMT